MHANVSPVEAAQGLNGDAPLAASAASERARAFVEAAGRSAEQLAALSQLVRLQARLMTHTRLGPAAIQLVGDLAQALACERVSLGLKTGHEMRLLAMSHGADDEFRGVLASELEAAMHEACDQDATLWVPLSQRPATVPRIVHAHGPLLARGAGSAITFPLRAHDTTLGAVTLEWRRSEPLAQLDVERMEHQLALLAPVLALLAASERPVHARVLQHLRTAWQASAPRRRAAWGLGLATLAAVLAWPATVHVGGQARVEAAIERAVTSPADGFIKAVSVRPGDSVKAGQVLVELADQDLKLDSQRLASELAQHESAYVAAMARSDRSQMAVNLARAEEARAQLELANARIHRAQVPAPFPGEVIGGDLTRSVGAPVKRGDVLLTLAPHQGNRVVILVDERDIAQVHAGQQASLALSAMPWDTLPLTVTRVLPIARTTEGANAFEVEATLLGGAGRIKPGMTGAARVTVDREPMAVSWGRRIGAWVRLHSWQAGW